MSVRDALDGLDVTRGPEYVDGQDGPRFGVDQLLDAFRIERVMPLFDVAEHGPSPDPTHRKEVYADIISGIRSNHPDPIICATTSGRLQNTFETRSPVLELEGDARPDMGSLTMGSLNFPKQASINQPEMVRNLALMMKDRGIVPEIEVFETGMI